MKNPYNRNSEYLDLLPEFLWNPNWLGEDEYNLWTCHTWKRDNPFLPAYHIWINYRFEPDQRGLMRAQVRNVWFRSEKLEVWIGDVKLEDQDLLDAKAEIRNRLMRALDREKKGLKGYPVRRYIFNVVASSPKVCLKGFHSHHEIQYNKRMAELAKSNGMKIPEHWLKATDDRFKEVSSLLPKNHNLEHVYSGDLDYRDYQESNANLINEIVNVNEEVDLINVDDEKCTNARALRIPAIPNSQLLDELWQLFCEYGFDKDRRWEYSYSVTQT